MPLASSQPHPPSRKDRRTTPDLKPISELIEALALCCQQGQTGSLYFVSADQHAGSFTLQAGKVITLRYACRQGVEALRSLQRVVQIQQLRSAAPSPWCSYRFTAKRVSVSEDASLPRTPTILTQLGWTVSSLSPTSVEALSVEALTEGHTEAGMHKGHLPDSVAMTTRLISSQEQAVMLQLLTYYLGPAARLVASKAFRQTQDLPHLLSLLAAKIPDSRDASEFQLRVRSAIQL